jgi:hypothetical protein
MDAARCGGVMSFDHDFLLAGFSLWFGEIDPRGVD